MANIESVLQENRVFPPAAEVVKNATISGMAAYEALCNEAERDFTGFWARLARENLHVAQAVHAGARREQCAVLQVVRRRRTQRLVQLPRQCRSQKGNGDKVAIIFEADDGKVTKITYKDLLARVCQLANGIKALGFKKGERAIIYMPMSIEAVVAMQACARLGITHSVVFGGFSAKSVQERVVDAGATLVIAADEQMRGGKAIALKPAIDEAFALGGCEGVRKVIVYKRTGGAVPWDAKRDVWMHDVMGGQATQLRARVGRRRASAVHPLHLGLDRQAQGRAALHRRLPAVGRADDEVGVRHQAVGRLLVHRRRRLGHGPHLCVLRAARHGRDRSDLRGRADISRRGPLLEDVPGPRRHGLLHGAHRDPLARSRPTRPIRRRSRPSTTCRSCASSGTVGEPINPEAWMWYYNNVGGQRAARSSTRSGRPRPAAT